MPKAAETHLQLIAEGRDGFDISFEKLDKTLSAWAKLASEPDGSFVWHPSPDQTVFGMIYDVAGQVRYVELRGTFSGESLSKIAAALRASDDELRVVELPRGELQKLPDVVNRLDSSPPCSKSGLEI